MAVMPGGQVLPPKLLHSAAGADANGAEMAVFSKSNGGYAFAIFQISGTVTTATIYFEGTVDGTNWVAIEAESVGASATKATSATAAGIWRAVVIGLVKVRARLDWTAGSVTVHGSLVA